MAKGKKGQCLLISSEQIFVFTGVNLALSVRLGAELSTQVAEDLQPGSSLQWVNQVAVLLRLGSRRESKVTHPSRLKKPAWLRATVTVQAAFGRAASLLLAQGAALSWPPMETPAPCLHGGCVAGSPPKIKGTILPCRGARYWMHAFWWSFPTFPYGACLKWIVDATGFLRIQQKAAAVWKGRGAVVRQIKALAFIRTGTFLAQLWTSCSFSSSAGRFTTETEGAPHVWTRQALRSKVSQLAEHLKVDYLEDAN